MLEWTIRELRGFAKRIAHSIRQPRRAFVGGKVYLRYSGAHLRQIRKRNGVGRPPSLKARTKL